MKKLKKSNKKKKIVIIVIFVLILGILAILVANQTSYTFVKFRAENYLCQKYDAKRSDFELVDYKHSHFYWEEYKIFLERLRWDDFLFEYKYNGKSFFVNRFKGQFYDDYQLHHAAVFHLHRSFLSYFL